MVVLVTGKSGQLGQSLVYISNSFPEIEFVFCNSAKLDITNLNNCIQVFSKYKPDFCINTAAYTAVDKAESEPEKAFLINVEGVKNLAEVCLLHNTTLLHISTDFVFDGTKNIPYTEKDETNPLGIYGKTKLEGEKIIQNTLTKYFIIRTSWVYSQFGNNFMKTMLRLASERDTISVVNDQIGTPTNAVDLANAIMKIIKSKKGDYGIYNYSNEGKCSWFDFACEIFANNGISIKVNPIPTTEFPTPAKRPKYSVLDKSKIRNVFGIKTKNWKLTLCECLKNEY